MCKNCSWTCDLWRLGTTTGQSWFTTAFKAPSTKPCWKLNPTHQGPAGCLGIDHCSNQSLSSGYYKVKQLLPRGSIVAAQDKIYIWKLRRNSYEMADQRWPLHSNGFSSISGIWSLINELCLTIVLICFLFFLPFLFSYISRKVSWHEREYVVQIMYSCQCLKLQLL